MKCARYLRVSRNDQNPQLQDDQTRDYLAHRRWQLTETYVDHGATGSHGRRPGLTRLLQDAKRGRFEVLLVWRSDRLFRSLRHMVTTLDDLAALNVGFASVTEPFDTSTPSGRLLVHLVSAMGEFEKAIMVERTKAGLQAAAKRGVRIGRPRVHVDLKRAHLLRAEGRTYKQIAADLGIGIATLHRAMREAS